MCSIDIIPIFFSGDFNLAEENLGLEISASAMSTLPARTDSTVSFSNRATRRRVRAPWLIFQGRDGSSRRQKGISG